MRSAGVADWITALGGNMERTLTAAAGPSPRDPYRHALTRRPPQTKAISYLERTKRFEGGVIRACAPLHRCAAVPLRRCAAAPLRRYAAAPLRRCAALASRSPRSPHARSRLSPLVAPRDTSPSRTIRFVGSWSHSSIHHTVRAYVTPGVSSFVLFRST